jgi:hypothetical protein
MNNETLSFENLRTHFLQLRVPQKESQKESRIVVKENAAPNLLISMLPARAEIYAQ